MGLVFKARRDGDDRPIALKVLKRQLSGDLIYQQRFQHEARAAAEVRDPHLVAILESAEWDGRHCLASDYVDGGSLTERIASGGPLPLADVVRVVTEVGSGLDALHAAGVMHRDIKPSNVLFDSDGTALLTDFGLAKGRAYTVLTRPGQVMGTLDYLAPELIRGKPATAATDIYALGCVAFECVAGRAPFADKSAFQVGLAHLEEPPPDPCAERPELPAGLLGGDPHRTREGTGATARDGRRVREPAAHRRRGGDRRMTPALVFSEGPLAGQRVEVDAELVLGREDASLTIDDEEISRRHAVIRPTDGGVEIEDLGSTNGTYVNAVRIEGPTRLAGGDTVKLGRSVLQVESARAAATVAAAVPPHLTALVRLAGTPLAAPAAHARPRRPRSAPTRVPSGQAQPRHREPPARAPADLVRDRRRDRRGARRSTSPTTELSAGRSRSSPRRRRARRSRSARPSPSPSCARPAAGRAPRPGPGRAPPRERSPARPRERPAPARPGGSSSRRARPPAAGAGR